MRAQVGDIPSGEVFHVPADGTLEGGQGAIRRVNFLTGAKGEKPRTLLQLVNEKLAGQGKPAAMRVDLRFGFGPQGQIFLLNKRDGVIRLMVPDGASRPRL